MSGDLRSHILIVDDEPEITEILFDLLTADYDCQTVGSAEEALALLEKGSLVNARG